MAFTWDSGSDSIPKQSEVAFANAGIATFHGRAHFIERSTIQVGDEILEGRYVVIAAGQKPADLKIPGIEHLTTSEQFLELAKESLSKLSLLGVVRMLDDTASRFSQNFLRSC